MVLKCVVYFAAGSEFLLPVRGFFCLLCKEFYGDAICAEEHVTTHAHNEKYKVFTCGKENHHTPTDGRVKSSIIVVKLFANVSRDFVTISIRVCGVRLVNV